MEEITIRKEDKILIIAPHADDESIGMGGFLSRYGNKCTIWLLTDGSRCKTDKGKKEIIDVRKKEFEASMKYFNVAEMVCFDISDRRLITNINLLEIEDISKFTKIFIPSSDESHIDHYSAHIAALKMIINSKSKADVFMYEITNPMRLYNCYIDITFVIDQKRDGINIYESQVSIFDYANAAISLNCFRASMHGLKNAYIEVFYKINEVIWGNDTVLNRYNFLRLEAKSKLLEKWLRLEINSHGLAEYLLVKKIVKLNIYGYGFWGKIVEQALEDSEVELLKVYDKKFAGKSGKYTNLSTETYNDNLIVISVLEGSELIKKSLNDMGYSKVIVLEDLLENLEDFKNEMEQCRT